ncbi:putative purine-uracil permease NCS1 [Iris pallida]|uniref:Purine-uracil permease NCS1 n=1 Tax=Iris pallida TaxID=29817 RepID=A0AAX6GPK2_IRIPA|nr:putative purine-uracil permease NCS1 [Iris pallida]
MTSTDPKLQEDSPSKDSLPPPRFSHHAILLPPPPPPPPPHRHSPPLSRHPPLCTAEPPQAPPRPSAPPARAPLPSPPQQQADAEVASSRALLRLGAHPALPPHLHRPRHGQPLGRPRRGVPSYYLAGSLVALGMAWWQGVATSSPPTPFSSYSSSPASPVPSTASPSPSSPALLRRLRRPRPHPPPRSRRLRLVWYRELDRRPGDLPPAPILPEGLAGDASADTMARHLRARVLVLPPLLARAAGDHLERHGRDPGPGEVLRPRPRPPHLLPLLGLRRGRRVRPDAVAAVPAAAGQFWPVFLPSLNANISFWATVALNIPDFTRYARSQRDQILGQLGLPVFMGLFTFVGLAVSSSTEVIFGQIISDPIRLLGRIGGGAAALLAIFGVGLATVTTNLAANVVAPANALASLSPSAFGGFRRGALATALLGAALQPWRLLASSESFVYTWLLGCSALVGPAGGIVLADYYLVKGMELDVGALYSEAPRGRYYYRKGFNAAAMAALLVGSCLWSPGSCTSSGSSPTSRKCLLCSTTMHGSLASLLQELCIG